MGTDFLYSAFFEKCFFFNRADKKPQHKIIAHRGGIPGYTERDNEIL